MHDSLERHADTVMAIEDVIGELHDHFESEPEFDHADIFELLLQASGSSGGILWESEAEEQFNLSLAAGFNPEDVDKESPHVLEELTEIDEAFEEHACLISEPRTSDGETASSECPLGLLRTHCRTLRIPIIHQGVCVAVVALFQPNSERARTEWGMAALIAIMQTIAARAPAEDQLEQRVHRLQIEVGRELEEEKACYIAANQLRDFFGTGRISVAIFRGTSCRVRAISGQAIFDRRSPIITAIQRIAANVCKSQAELWHPEDDETIPPQLAAQLERYYEVADTKSLACLPLVYQHEPSDDPKDLSAAIRDREARPGKCVGVVVVEGIDDVITRHDLDGWEAAQPSVTHAIYNARRYEGLFLMPVWRALGTFVDLFRGHHRNKAILGATIVLGFILSLCLIPAEFKLRAHGTIQPVQRSQVYAETKGVVNEILVADGDWVEAGQLLARLENPELGAKLAEKEGKLRESRQRHRMLMLQRANRDFRSEDDLRTAIRDAAALEANIAGLQQQVDVLRKQVAQLRIVSPTEGQVVSWDVLRRLRGRPVEAGFKLMTVANPQGPWELELRLPDRRSGYLLDYVKHAPTPRTSYVLKSDPTVIREAQLREVAKSANVHDQDGNVVRVYANLENDSGDLGHVRPGTEVISHIHAGRKPLGYCKLYEFFDWVKRVWFSHA